MSNSSRTFVLATVFAAVAVAAVTLVMSGVNLTSKQKRASELATVIERQQVRMKDLYNRRSIMVQAWLDEKAAAPKAADVRPEAAEGTEAVPETTAKPAPVDKKADEALVAVKAALDESRTIELLTQNDFDRFDRLQNEISNYVASHLLEQLRQEAAQGKGGDSLVEQIREFEKLEMEIANTRRDYHAAAFERNELVDSLSHVPFGLAQAPVPVPVFAAEATLYQQGVSAAGR